MKRAYLSHQSNYHNIHKCFQNFTVIKGRVYCMCPTTLNVDIKTFIVQGTVIITAEGRAAAQQQHDSISAVCVFTRVCLCLFMLCECRHAWICMYEWMCVSTCERVSECVYSVGPRSPSVDLKQPSPALFAQDMPQEAKTTVRVCPCCQPLLIHPTAAFFQRRRYVYQCFYTFILWNLSGRAILADLFWGNAQQERSQQNLPQAS